jgi:RNA polymerase sigma-70 factor (ECF subfamily)
MWQDSSNVPVAIDPTDPALLHRIVLRDESALAEFYDRHSKLVYSVALRILRSPSEAEEILQEAFVKVWSRAETYEIRLGSPAAWLARIARNCAIDRVRAKRARQMVDAAPPDTDEPSRSEPSTTVTPEVMLEDATKAGLIRGALGSLPPNQRTLIEAAFFDGYTHQELADRYGVPLGTVKARIRTGLLALRSQLTHAL